MSTEVSICPKCGERLPTATMRQCEACEKWQAEFDRNREKINRLAAKAVNDWNARR